MRLTNSHAGHILNRDSLPSSSDMRSKVQIFSLLFVAIFSLTLSHASDIPTPSVVPNTTSELSPEDKLLRLAKEHFKEDKQYVLPAEEILLRAVATDKPVDFLTGTQNDVDPQIAAQWKEDRIIRANRLAWLCTDAAASALVSSRDISISGARIDGALSDFHYTRGSASSRGRSIWIIVVFAPSFCSILISQT
jgi:hypothetical protein